MGDMEGISRATFSSEGDNAAQRAIDQQLATLLEQVCVLRRRRNAASGVSRLPEEILCRIFKTARDMDPMRGAGPAVCVCITHVCSAWRNMALRFPGLWNRIHPSYSLSWVEEMMARSRAAPLHAHVHAGRQLHTLTAVLSDESVKRIKDVTISGLKFPVPALKMHCPSIFECHSPLLERFSITFDPIAFDPRFESMAIERLFSEGTPRLYHLSMDGCFLPWNSPILRSPLTSLKLKLPGNLGTVETWTIEQFTTVLEGLPALQTLELHHVLPPVDYIFSAPEVHRVIILPRLAYLSITSHTFSRCSPLLDRLALAPTTSIRLECSTHEEPRGFPPQLPFSSLTYLCDLLQLQHDTDTAVAPIGSAEWSFDRTSFMTLALWRESRPTYGKPFLELVLPTYAPNLLAIPSLVAALPLEGLGHISFFRDIPQSWLLALTPFQHVESIFVVDIAPPAGILHALAHRIFELSPAFSEARPRFLFPALSTLVIARSTLLNLGGDHGRSLFADLRAVLRMRRRHGHGVKTLRLTACEVTEGQLVKLRQVVDTVICEKEAMNTIVPQMDGVGHGDFDGDDEALEA
ncbi:hypothetical protein FPV67DRAFT_1201529 [Lyophyllum atratum]|nr:hypothetical protein FPV67DRAFT_1201529 [Lyophyllum atratum]